MENPNKNVEIRKSVCTPRHSNCGVLVHIKDGREIKIEGDPDHPRMHCGPNVAKLTTSIGLDYHYLAVALRSIVVQDQIRGITKLTAQPNLSMKTIRQLIIPVPSPQEQQRIITQLNTLQGEMDVLKRLQAETSIELDALLPSIMDRAFEGES